MRIRTNRDHQALSDPENLAAEARSIVSCPADVELLVDGVATVLAEDGPAGTPGRAMGRATGDVIGLQDVHGAPTFSCHLGSELADAAELGRSALLTLTSGLGSRDAAERTDRLVLAGRLEARGVETCACCDETRSVVALRLNFALLTHAGDSEIGEQQFRVPLEHFTSAAHHLNRGFLQRSVEHANDCHQDELRRAISLSANTRLAEVLGVRLTGLSARGVEVSWVDLDGAHRTRIDFPRAARDATELGELLRRELNAGLC